MKKFPIFLSLAIAALALSFTINSNVPVSKTLKINDFQGITVNGAYQVFLKQGNRQSVKIEGEESAINKISTKVTNGIWSIRVKGNKKNSCGNSYSNSYNNTNKALKIYITMPKLTSIALNGSGKVNTEKNFRVQNLDLRLTGSGKMRLGLNASSIESSICGSGKLALNGRAKHLESKVTGSGDVDAEDMEVENVHVSVSGSGDVNVHATEYLKAQVAGSGSVYYKGSPSIHKKVSGSGSISKI